ncbi:MAG: alpha/beta hydrolase [Bacteroidetes bacterium]|nr:alpha/beta hydrolase [Fibrella sp.]
MTPTSTPQTYVLVHGAALGKYIWERVQQRLMADGHTVITLDLPGHGEDCTPVDQITLDTYIQAVIKAIGDHTDVVLVGHSFGGFVTAQVAEAIPKQIVKLVYLAAPVIQNGQNNAEVSQQDLKSVLNPNSVLNEGMIEFPGKWIGLALCNDCLPDDVNMLAGKVRPFPLGPLLTPVKLTADHFGTVPKYYILTTQDKTVSYPFQQKMLTWLEFTKTYTLDTSHMPMLSQPTELVRILEQL